jgi:hypothetical protein
MSSISYSSSLFITIEDDEDWIWSIKEFVTIIRNKNVWKMLCVFIEDSRFNWQAFFRILMTLYDSIYLWFNFLNECSILIFLMNNQIMSSHLYLDDDVFFWSAYLFCMFCVWASFFLINSQMSFIFSTIQTSFCVNTRFLIDNRSRATFFEFDESKLIRDSYS